MSFIKKNGSTMKQMAYARKLFSADGINKKQMALDVGYSSNVANSISSHIENKPGFHNAMSALAVDSNNLALAAMHEFKARGFEDFSVIPGNNAPPIQQEEPVVVTETKVEPNPEF